MIVDVLDVRAFLRTHTIHPLGPGTQSLPLGHLNHSYGIVCSPHRGIGLGKGKWVIFDHELEVLGIRVLAGRSDRPSR